jgi:hypothetical protein
MRDRIVTKQLNWAGVNTKVEEKPTEQSSNDSPYASKADIVELKR